MTTRRYYSLEEVLHVLGPDVSVAENQLLAVQLIGPGETEDGMALNIATWWSYSGELIIHDPPRPFDTRMCGGLIRIRPQPNPDILRARMAGLLHCHFCGPERRCLPASWPEANIYCPNFQLDPALVEADATPQPPTLGTS